MYDARTMEKGKKNLSFRLDSHVQTDLFNENVTPSQKTQGLIPIAPGIEYSWGSRRKVDMSLGFSIGDGLSYGTKIRLGGQPGGRTAAAIYPKLSFGSDFDEVLFALKVPLLFSYYGKQDKFSVTYSPGFQFSSQEITGGSNLALYNSLNVMAGKKNKVVFSSSFALAGKAFGMQTTVGYNIRFGGGKP